MIRLKNVSLSYAMAQEPILHDINLHIPSGQTVLLCGPSGCGKTTLTRLMNGLAVHFDGAAVHGSVSVCGRDAVAAPLYETARDVGSVFQNPRSQFFCVDVTSEIAFGCENQGLPEDDILQRIDATATRMQVRELLGRSIFKLSGGQKQKVACASVAAMTPQVYVLDEPSSNLDADALSLLHDTLLQWRAQGATIVIAEHRLRWLADTCDRVVVLEKGRIAKDLSMRELVNMDAHQVRNLGLRPLHPWQEKRASLAGKNTIRRVCTLHDFRFRYDREQGAPALSIERASVPEKEITAIIGHNGAGKTTLSSCLCGLHRRFSGTLVLADGTRLGRTQLLKRSYLVMQDTNHQLFCESVNDEVRLGMDPAREDEVPRILERLGLTGLEQRHPLSLSGGQKQRVAIAAALLAGKDLLVFDEPTSGLDLAHMQATAKLIADLRGHATVFLVTHDLEFILQCADHILHLEHGVVTENYELDEEGVTRVANFFENTTKDMESIWK